MSIMNDNFDIPEHLDFPVAFEDTRVDDKKYVINETTGDYLGIVGSGFNCASHGDFFRGVLSTVTEELEPDDIANARLVWRQARNGAWTMLDLQLPDMTTKISTEKHEVDIGNRIVALHGIDGSCSNTVIFGAIDFFCTNGMISGSYDTIRRKNTTNFRLDSFIHELHNARTDFYDQAAKMQVWANTSTVHVDIKTLLDDMITSKRKSALMYNLYNDEARVRGHNKWALYSAFTNYASWADERNGFSLRDTGKDTGAINMWGREQEVSKWVSDAHFVDLQYTDLRPAGELV
jgi:hypothetical protein